MLGSQLLLPFVNLDDPNFLGGATYSLTFTSAMMGGNLKSLSVFSVGLSPWMSAMILWQMFTLSKKSNLGKLPIEIQDRRRMYLTLGIALIQSLAVSLNLPILERGTTESIIKEEKLDKVYVAGHSLGGVVASLDAVQLKKENHLAGIILLASYFDKSVDFSNSDVPVLSIIASNDKVLNWTKYIKSKNRLPQTFEQEFIFEGNHSGFGSYGKQIGDGERSMSDRRQQKITSEKIAKFIKEQNKNVQ